MPFKIEVVRIPVQVTLADATATEGAALEFAMRLSRAVSRPITLHWTVGRPGSATPGEDYSADVAGQVTVDAGTTTQPRRASGVWEWCWWVWGGRWRRTRRT